MAWNQYSRRNFTGKLCVFFDTLILLQLVIRHSRTVLLVKHTIHENLVIVDMIFSTESGKHTPEYKSLLGNLVRITESLKAEPDRTDMLRLKFIERMWINLHSDMNASELVSLAIQRTGEDSRIFNEFVTLLSEISGMDALAKDLHDCKLQLN